MKFIAITDGDVRHHFFRVSTKVIQTGFGQAILHVADRATTFYITTGMTDQIGQVSWHVLCRAGSGMLCRQGMVPVWDMRNPDTPPDWARLEEAINRALRELTRRWPSDSLPESEEQENSVYRDGWDARQEWDGMSSTRGGILANPYKRHSGMWDAWRKGWLDRDEAIRSVAIGKANETRAAAEAEIAQASKVKRPLGRIQEEPTREEYNRAEAAEAALAPMPTNREVAEQFEHDEPIYSERDLAEALSTARREAAAEATEQAAKVAETYDGDGIRDAGEGRPFGNAFAAKEGIANRIRAQSPSPTSERG